MFFHDATRKTRTTCKIPTFFEDHSLLNPKSHLNIRNYSPEVGNIQRRKEDLNITLPRLNNFNIKQKMARNVCFIIYPQHQTKSKWVNANKAQNISVTT